MNIEDIIPQLENNKEVFKSLLGNIYKQFYLWRPQPEKWCLLEIVCHLVDEEQYDFRARVKHVLYNPEKDLVPIDPVGWVKQHDYISKDYNETVRLFLEERTNSIHWLKQQTNVVWGNAILHPHLGKLSAELFLRNWLAHDYLHIRQILRYKYEYFKNSSDVDLSYAGNW